MTEQALIDFYKFTSRDINMFSEFPKKFKAFVKTKTDYKFLPNKKYVYLLEREEGNFKKGVNISYKGKLTTEQEHVMDILDKRNFLSYHTGLINMKTGKGKSHIIMNITAMFQTTTLIMCHNKKTLIEMVEKFKEYTNITPGVYYGDKKDIQPITITTHDSFVLNNGNIGRHFDVIIYDECDYDLSQQMFNALCNSNAEALYGLTGTPYSKHFNNADMQKIFWKEISYKEDAQDNGYNLIPIIETYRYKSAKFKEYEYNNWAEEKQCLVDDTDRLKAQIDLVKHVLKKWRKAILILTERVEEAQNYFDALEDMWIDEPHEIFGLILIHGNTKIKDDNHSLDIYLKEPFTAPVVIIWTIWKMARWVDIPAIDTVMLFSALHFRGTVVQAVGRGLRNYPWKTETLLIDWQDYPILANQWYARKAAYKKEYQILDKDITSYNITDKGKYDKSN